MHLVYIFIFTVAWPSIQCDAPENGETRGNSEEGSKVNGNKMDEATEEQSSQFHAIFPGTKWCGNGNIAKNYDDLGSEEDTDRCCRTHDHCNDTLAPGETRNNITNTSPFTKLNCACDNAFYNCLDRVNTPTSNAVGNLYFNILKKDCYKKVYPLTNKCKKYETHLKLKCIEYKRNMTAPMVYESFPAKKYKRPL